MIQTKRIEQKRVVHLDGKVINAIHVEILGNLQVLQLRLVPSHALVVSVPDFDPVLPHLRRHLVLVNDSLRQQVLRRQEARLVRRFVKVAVLGPKNG